MISPKLNHAFPILVGVLFFLRGLQLQCVYPPLEGPDEYQHIAYIVYILEENKIPEFGKAMVPKSLYPCLLANPHCTYDWEQTREIGCLRYEDFYDQQPHLIGNPDILLYQAQHLPFYYILVSPVFSWVSGSFGFREAVYTLRIINIFLASVAIVFLISPIKHIFQDQKSMRLSMLAVSMVPMFMTYVSRVTNDALALTFAGIAVYLLTRIANNRRLIMKAALIGGMIGLGVLTKLIVFCLLPASLVFLAYLSGAHKIPIRKAVICSLAIIGCYFILTHRYHFQSYATFHTAFPSADTMKNAATDKTFLDVIAQIRFEHIKNYFVKWLIVGNLWTSGWSFLLPHRMFLYIYARILALSLFGLVPIIIPAFRHLLQIKLRLQPNLVLCGLIVIFSFAAAYIQTLKSILAYGQIATVSYYVMLGYPAFLICVLAAAQGYGKTGVSISATALIVLFLTTEYHSVLGIAIRHWADSKNLQEIFQRLASVHPAFLRPEFFFPLAAIVCSLTLLLIIVAILLRDQVENDIFFKNFK